MAANLDWPADFAAAFEAVPRRDGADVVVLFRGELDLAGVPRVAQLTLALDSVESERIVLDLSELSFIDACGVGAIERAHDRLSDRGTEVVVRHPQAAVRRTLVLCGLDERLDAEETVDPGRLGLWRRCMEVSKDRILTLLREGGDEQKADAVARELPDPVDLERDRGTLEDLGLDPKELLQKITGEGIPRLS